MHESWLQDFLIFFAAAGLVVPLFYRARLGAVLSFLVVGVVVGPYGLGRLSTDHSWLSYLVIEDRERVEPFAELGVMFLLFIVGLELSLPRLWAMRRLVFGLGGVQVIATASAMAAVLLLLGMPGEPAVVIGLAFAMSSTAIVIQLLEEQGRSATPLGRLALAVLLFQDLMVAPALFVTGVLTRGGDHIALLLLLSVLQAAVAIVVIVVVGRFALRPLLLFAAKTGSRDLVIAIAVLMIVAVAAGTGAAGLSTALGAFLAGLLLAETEYRHQLEVDLSPFKGLLLGVFFVSVGMTLDLKVVWAQLGLVLCAVASLLVLKAVILFAAARAFRCPLPTAIETSLLLSQAGEFAFIIVALARMGGLIDIEALHVLTAVAVLSMIVTPGLAILGRRLGERSERRERTAQEPSHSVEEIEDHVIIGGFGRMGQMVARLLEAENIPYVAFDTSSDVVTHWRSRVRGHLYFGDASRGELLERACGRRARAFVVTLDSVHAAERMVEAARTVNDEAAIYARATDTHHANRMMAAGAVHAVPEVVEVSLQLGAHLLTALGVSEEAAATRIEAMRIAERERAGDGG